MKTIVNKTHRPLRVPLPRGKVLHLGPDATGQVSHNNLEHPPFQALVEEGVVEIQGDGTSVEAASAPGGNPSTETQGHHPPTGSQVRGNRGG